MKRRPTYLTSEPLSQYKGGDWPKRKIAFTFRWIKLCAQNIEIKSFPLSRWPNWSFAKQEDLGFHSFVQNGLGSKVVG